ncbi:MAG: elongation factor Ts [Halobacteriovoraceae bacterium]|nr:elongation factor Ts [Halobacteriovoraceae bacterium]
MSISAKDVKDLRELTGAGMMDCKKALAESNGDKDKAVDYLRAKGLAKAAKKAGRIAAEGLVECYVTDDGKTGAVVEVNCETDFVAKNADFKKFVTDVAKQAATATAKTNEELLNSTLGSTKVEDEINNLTLKIGEKIAFRRFEKVAASENGYVGSYVHSGKIGVLTKVNSDKNLNSDETFKDLVKDICMHIAASDTRFINESEIDEGFKNKEAEVYAAQLKEEGKPEKMIPNIVQGKLKKLASEICLLQQKFVKDPDVTVGSYIKSVADKLGAQVSVENFLKYNMGEGIEKKEDNLAEEVAKMTGGN